MISTMLQADLDTLQLMRVDIEQKAAQGIHEYWKIYKWLADKLESNYGYTDTNETILWLRGATEANAGRGAMSELIRVFTDTQYMFHYGTHVTKEMMQDASDEVAKNLIRNLFGEISAETYGVIPEIAKIAEDDATAVGRVLFNQIDDTSAPPNNSAWSGTLLFTDLRSDQTYRLMSTGASVQKIDTLNDWRDVLYAYISYAEGFKAARSEFLLESAGQAITDMSVMSPTLKGYIQGDGTLSSLFNALIVGTDNATLKDAFSLIHDVGQNKFLDMLMGAVLGRPVLGQTTDANFYNTAKTFFASDAVKALSAERLPTNAASLIAKANTDVNTRAALAALSLISVPVNAEIAAKFTLYDANTNSGEITTQWIEDRSRMLVDLYDSKMGLRDENNSDNIYHLGGQLSETWQFADLTTNVQVLESFGRNKTHYITFGNDLPDLINGGSESDRLYGGKGNDTLNGLAGNDYLEGGEGSDTLDGGEGNDQLLGGSGSDTYSFTAQFGSDTILDSDGSGSIVIDGVTLAAGTQLNPNLWKSADGAYRISVAPNVDGIANSQTLIITKVDDLQNSITVKSWRDGDLGITLVRDETPEVPTNIDTANDGNNVIINRSTVFGLEGNDYILATDNNDYIYGDGGNDLISTKDGSDTIDGGAGNDIIFGGLGRDVIFGGNGNDLIFSSATLNMQKSEIQQRIGNPISGQTDLDQVYADVDYYINPSYSTETDRYGYYIDFGSGVTTTILPLVESGITSHNQNYLFLNYYSFLNYGAGFAGEDAVYGGAGNDFILGSSDSDVLDGGDDDDKIFGLNGNDFLFGGNGKDEVYGGDGLDIIRGGDQDDKLFGGYDKDIIYGDGGNDYIQGDIDNLFGTNAPPGTVNYARYGDDELYGGAGNDIIIGNGGSDVIHGGDDNDQIDGDSEDLAGQYHGSDTLYGDAGDDRIVGQGGADTLYGGDGNDQLAGDSSGLDGQYHGNDTIFGNNGDDKIWGQGGADTIDGGAGNDQIAGDDWDLAATFHGNDTIDGGAGDDIIWGQGGNDTIYGGDGDDTLDGDDSSLSGANHGDDVIDGGDGNDTILGRGGKDTITGGDGNDIIQGDANGLEGIYHGNDTIDGGAGNDQIWGQGGNDVIQAGDGDDYVEGDDKALDGQYHGDDIIYGGRGNDNLWGNGGNDTIYGGDGNDSIQGDSQGDRQHDGNDTLYGGAGNDSLAGYDGNDTLDGGTGDDILFAGNGNDVLISNDGNDQLTGGAGDDEYHIRVRASEVKILDNSGDNHVYLEGAFDSSKISIKNYTNAASIIAPTPSDDPSALFPEFKLTFFDGSTTQPTADGGVLTDEYGNIVTGGYNHYLHFTDTNGAEQAIHVETYLKEKQGLSFYLWTGSWHGIQAPFLIYTNSQINSNDQLIFDGSVIGDDIDISTIRTNTQNNGGSLADVYRLGAGDDTVEGSAIGDIIFGEAGDDTIHGLGGNDTLDGGDGNDVLEGGDGDDIINGGAGNDTLDGGSGANVLYGEAGNDTLKGGVGNDTISGGTGNDNLQGGAGADLYRFSQGDGSDTIIDTGLVGEESTISFNGVLASSVELILSQNDLIIKYGSSDQILVKDFFINSSIKEVNFSDGSKWSYNDIVDQLKLITYGTSGSDVITGVNIIRNEIYGLDGDDTLIGGLKADIIYGGNGSDYLGAGSGDNNQLYGESGDDTLSAYGNNNILDGGDGNNRLAVTGSNNILIGGSGYNSFAASGGSNNIIKSGSGYNYYDITGATGTSISDVSGSGLITIDSGAIYFKFSPTGWGGGSYYVDISPNTRLSELVSSTVSNGVTYESYKYTKYNRRLADLTYDAISGKLTLHKDGSSENSSFASFVNGFDYFTIDQVFTLADLTRIKTLNVEISGQGTHSSTGSLYTTFQSTTLSFADFIDQGTVKATYGSGDDVIYGLTAWGGAGSDGDIIYAGAGNDHIYTGAGSSVVYGEDGNDYIVASDIFASDKVYAGSGDDTVYLYDPTLATQPTVNPDGSSYITDTVYGGDGNDIIYTGNLSGATAYGDAGDDVIQGGGQLFGGDGNDTLISLGSYGGHLSGGAGNDILIGGDGGSYLDGGAGADSMYGGLGDDTFVIDDVNDQFFENADSGYDRIVIAANVDLQTAKYSMLESVELTGVGNFSVLGNAEDNSLFGNDGDNYLDGREGADYLEGGEGGDYYVLTAEDSYLENGHTGIDTIERWYDTNYVLESNIENLVLKGDAKLGFGNDSDNVITGNSQNNYIDALAGNDTVIIGQGGGTDTLSFEDVQSATDTLRVVGISENDLIAQRFSGQDDIYFSIRGTNDHFWLLNYYKAATDNGDGTFSDSKVDQIVFDSGKVWRDADIQALVNRAATDRAPTVNQFPPTLTGSQGNLFSYTFAANTIVDPDVWDSVVYSITLTTKNASGQYNSIPSWLTFDPATRTLSGTPTSTNVGTLQFYLWGTDMYGKGTGAGVTLNITPPNHAPVIANPVPDQTFADGRLFSYTIASNSFTDPDGDAMTYQLTLADGSALPSWLTFNATTRVLSGTSPDNTTTPITLKITAKDIVGNTTSDLFDLKFTVQNLTINGTSGVDTLIGGTGNDTLTGLAGNDTLKGGAGNDTLDGGTGNDTLIGGTGNDLYIVDSASDVITENANEGTDSIQSSVTYTLAANVENLTLTGTTAINGTGNALNNILIGNSAVNTLTGGAGDDTLDGGAGNDTLIGGTGNDLYIVDNTSDVVTENANEGTDIVQSTVTYTLGNNVENLTLLGTAAISGTGNALNNVIIGNSAANTLNGGAGNDSLIGGLGDDTYIVDSAADTITENANEGTDTVQSSVAYTLAANIENLTLTGTTAINGTGNASNNVLIGNSATNTLTGGAGDDTLNGGAGNDILIGGTGNDLYIVDSVSDVITENVNEGTDSVQTSVTYTLGNNVENLTLTGTTAINGTGNALNNILIGNSAVNTLIGGDGDDTLNGGAGNDALKGGLGNDLYIVDSTSDVITENANEGTDSVQSSVTYTLVTNVENLTLTGTTAINGTGNASNNILIGNSGANILTGGAGDDILDGGAGNDTLKGGLGNDLYIVDSTSDVITENANEGTDSVQSSVTYTLAANVENLTLTGSNAINATGNALANILIGNSGINTLTGAAGNDTYYLSRTSSNDSIVESDTTAGNQDVLQMTSDIRADQLWFRHVGTDLEVSVIGTSNSATIKNWYTANQYHVELFKSGDGKTLTDTKVQNLVNAMASMTPPAAGQTDLSTSYQTTLNPVLAANWT